METESSQLITKGKCWCCWETTDTADDPLIRVCRGCKDPDLQFIHQQCIDRYISALPSPSSSGLEEHSFYCTRCKDPYLVESTPIHPLNVLYHEQFLFTSMVVITFCMISLTVCCILLILQNFNEPSIAIFHIPIWALAGGMLWFCHVVHLFTWLLVLKHCSGKFQRHVLALYDELEPMFLGYGSCRQ